MQVDEAGRDGEAGGVELAGGGGVSMRQGSHQFDIIRSVTSRAATRLTAAATSNTNGNGDSGYSALVEYSDELCATAFYSGRGGFDSRLLSFGIGEAAETIADPGSLYPLPPAGRTPASPMFGFTIASFEGGDVVPSPWGLNVHRPAREAVSLPYSTARSGWDAVLDELDDALAGAATLHSGAWSIGTLEMCCAVGESARTKRPVTLRHQ